ncbi:hypothetical protein D3C73_823340 [compost metagenome]
MASESLLCVTLGGNGAAWEVAILDTTNRQDNGIAACTQRFFETGAFWILIIGFVRFNWMKK